MSRLIRFALCAMCFVAITCRKEVPVERELTPATATTADTSYKCHQVTPIDAKFVWPVPADAEQTSVGVHTKRVIQGRGATPKLGSHQVLLLCVTYYDRHGAVLEHDPLLVHNIDLPPKEWQEVLSRMTEGEVRRFWISPRRHVKEFVIGDFELQPFPEYVPARTPPPSPH